MHSRCGDCLHCHFVHNWAGTDHAPVISAQLCCAAARQSGRPRSLGFSPQTRIVFRFQETPPSAKPISYGTCGRYPAARPPSPARPSGDALIPAPPGYPGGPGSCCQGRSDPAPSCRIAGQRATIARHNRLALTGRGGAACVGSYAAAFRSVFLIGSISANPVSSTGSRPGSSAMMRTRPPIASTTSFRVESSMSGLLLNPRDRCLGLPVRLAICACVLPSPCADHAASISWAINCSARRPNGFALVRGKGSNDCIQSPTHARLLLLPPGLGYGDQLLVEPNLLGATLVACHEQNGDPPVERQTAPAQTPPPASNRNSFRFAIPLPLIVSTVALPRLGPTASRKRG